MAFICNLQEHWYTLRRFGDLPSRWYNLNSLLSQPEWVSQTYLGMMLQSLQQSGYSIFVVAGDLQHCKADDMALELPEPSSRGAVADRTVDVGARIKEKSLEMEEEEEVRMAIELSLLESHSGGGGMTTQEESSPEEMRRKRLERFGG